MGLFESIFGKKKQPMTNGVFKTLTAYQPTFTDFGGSIYEDGLVRSAINARANHISKLNVSIAGAGKPYLTRMLKSAPNEWQTWSQFLYRLSTILDVQGTAFIVPTVNKYGETVGLFPVLPSRCELVKVNEEPYLRYSFVNGQKAVMELSSCGIMTKFQYRDDFFGSDNMALKSTMDLIAIQNQGIKEGVKSAASYRFMAQVNNFTSAADLAKEKSRFNKDNLSGEGGLLLFPNTYANIKQIDSKPFVVDAEQLKIIQNNVYNYFGVNEDVLQNKCFGDAWTAFYEGAIEPFALQLATVLTRMLFTQRERAAGNEVIVQASRLMYMDTSSKLSMSAQMLDRGIMSRNEIREMWNLNPIEGGDEYILRGEYKNSGETNDETEQDMTGDEDNAEEE